MKRYWKVKVLLLIALTMLSAQASRAQTSIWNGLVAYYPFDKDSNDHSGFGNNLKLNGGASIVVNGKFGGALSLGNGASSETDYAIASGDNPNLDFGSSDFTIQAWVNFADLSRIETILEKFTGSRGPGWSLSNLPGDLEFYGTSGSLDASFHFPAVDVWYQIVVVRSGGVVTLYVDTAGGGLNSIGFVALGAIPTSTNPLLVGIRDLAASQPLGFNGLIDDVAIWDRALTTSEISLLNTNPLSSLAFLQSGSFVIGDLNATVGNPVTFWGAQWAKVNSLNGGPAPNAFKGFADMTSTTRPTCGGMWSTDPGNSSGPPASVPPFMAVIASSSITKSGATISGDVPKIVIVKTNPGYGPSPGQTGTGTVVAVLCGN